MHTSRKVPPPPLRQTRDRFAGTIREGRGAWFRFRQHHPLACPRLSPVTACPAGKVVDRRLGIASPAPALNNAARIAVRGNDGVLYVPVVLHIAVPEPPRCRCRVVLRPAPSPRCPSERRDAVSARSRQLAINPLKSGPNTPSRQAQSQVLPLQALSASGVRTENPCVTSSKPNPAR